MQQLLMRLAGTLSRRRAYAASHPMVQTAEEQLYDSISSHLRVNDVLAIGIARTDLVINGEPYVTRGSFARELAARLHRRGVGALTLIQGVTLDQLRSLMTWLAREHTTQDAAAADRPPKLAAITISMVAYDQLVLGDERKTAQASSERLWRSLARLATDTQVAGGLVTGLSEHGGTGTGHGLGAPGTGGDASGTSQDGAEIDRAAVVTALRDRVMNPIVAQRTAVALLELATEASTAKGDLREQIGQQLHGALEQLGDSSFASIIQGLGRRSLQQRFVSQVVDVLPVATVVTWLQSAATAGDQQLSHHLLRIMSKLSTVAETQHSPASEEVFRGAAKQLVKDWTLDDPNPSEHVALLDRIALAESRGKRTAPTRSSIVESSRVVQMALELDTVGDDARAGAEALIDSGAVGELLEWLHLAGDTSASRILRSAATSDKAVKQLLLTEPVDRLRARTMLESLQPDACDTLIDVLGAAQSRSTRMLVRQRLSEFGASIRPQLFARLDQAPWYLVRNLLTLISESGDPTGEGHRTNAFLLELLDHAQVQVRIEALRILANDPQTRENALQRALKDTDEKMIVVALQELTEPIANELPPPLSTPVMAALVAMVEAEKHSDSTRAKMVRAMATMRHKEVCAWLIRLSTKRTRFLRRLSLAEPTRTAVSALQALQRVYPDDPQAARVIALATAPGHDPRWHAREPAQGAEGPQ